jgi:hypothetical protein
VRNLPRRNFYEEELRALVITCLDSYKEKNEKIKGAAKKMIR